MGKISKMIMILFGFDKSKPISEETVAMRALKQQLKTMEEIVCSQDDLIRQYAKEQNNIKKGNMEDKMLEFGMNLFAPKPDIQQTLPLNNSQLETGRDYSESELKDLLNKIPPTQQKILKSKPVSQVVEFANNQGLNISETSVKKAMEMMA